MAILSYRDKDGNIKEIPALRGEKGEPGNDYILTENDKQEIANMVPIDEAVTDLIGDKTEIFSLASYTDVFGYIDATGEPIYGDADTSESAIYSYELSYIDDLKPLSNIIHVKTKVYDYMGYRATGYSGEHVLLEFGTPSTMSETKFENNIWEFDIDLSQYDYDLINIDISSCDGSPQVSWLKDTVWEEIKNLNNHINDFENPHQVTAEQIGAIKTEELANKIDEIISQQRDDFIESGETTPTVEAIYGIANVAASDTVYAETYTILNDNGLVVYNGDTEEQESHAYLTNNPHEVTAEQIGAISIDELNNLQKQIFDALSQKTQVQIIVWEEND